MTELEQLKLENLHLKRQMLQMQGQMLEQEFMKVQKAIDELTPKEEDSEH